MKQKIIKAGNSLAVTIPSSFIKNIGINPGDEVNVEPQPDHGQIIYKFSGIRQLSLTQK